jgi:hypothetical protein
VVRSDIFWDQIYLKRGNFYRTHGTDVAKRGKREGGIGNREKQRCHGKAGLRTED